MSLRIEEEVSKSSQVLQPSGCCKSGMERREKDSAGIHHRPYVFALFPHEPDTRHRWSAFLVPVTKPLETAAWTYRCPDQLLPRSRDPAFDHRVGVKVRLAPENLVNRGATGRGRSLSLIFCDPRAWMLLTSPTTTSSARSHVPTRPIGATSHLGKLSCESQTG